MRTYEVTVKTPAYYAREGAGRSVTMKLLAASRRSAASFAVREFAKEYEVRDMIGRTMTVQIVRVA